MNYRFNQSAMVLSGWLLLFSCQHEPLFDNMPGEDNMPDSSDTNPPRNGVACSPDTVYFVNDVLPLINSNCALSGCHGDGSAQNGVDLTTYTSIINTADVRPFRPDNSKLYRMITEKDNDDRMPPPPANRLTSDQIQIIETWITQGALYNSCDDCNSEETTFNNQIGPLISKTCQGCHSGPSPSGGILLTNHTQIQTRALNGQLLGAVNHNPGFTPMPYNLPKLDQCLIDQIQKWAEAGALNN